MDIRRLILFAIGFVVFLGLLVAASNLPVLTHCQFYGECSGAQLNPASGTGPGLAEPEN